MARYSSERKAALLKKLLPPINMSVAELARQENISEVTLYNWRKHAKDGGSPAAFFKIVVAQSCFKQPLSAPARVSRAAPDLASRHR